MAKVSVVIPARNERFLVPTVNDVLTQARDDVEVIVCLDGYTEPALPVDHRLSVIEKPASEGMRPGINDAVARATGEFILKIDGHVKLPEGYDVELSSRCEPDWVVIPRRKRLEPETWTIQYVNKPDVDYEYLTFPDNPADFGGPGLNGRPWTQRILERQNRLLDDNMSFQGSGWFMRRDYFHRLGLMDSDSYGPFWNEAQEIGLKAWLSGGRVMTNKYTWYAHLHKGKKYGRGYNMDGKWLTQGATFTKKWLTNSAWAGQTRPFEWLIDHFWPVPGWPVDWREQLARLT